ncbi:MAG: hypothetical protein ACI3W5_15675 [Faecousia sp.]
MYKYEFTGETKVFEEEILLRRIRALRDIGGVKAGTLGGWIEKEDNLRQDGDAWVADNGIVMGNSMLLGKARVSDEAIVMGNAVITGHAHVRDNATVAGNAFLAGYAIVGGQACVSDFAVVEDHAVVTSSAILGEFAHVGGDAVITAEAYLSEHANITSQNHFLSIGPIGSRDDFVTFYRAMEDEEPEIRVKCGCFRGSLEDFEKTC